VVDFPGLAGLARGLVVEQLNGIAGAPKSIFVPLAEGAELVASTKVLYFLFHIFKMYISTIYAFLMYV